MNPLVKDSHTLVLKSKETKKLIFVIDFLIYDAGVKIVCAADKHYSVAFNIRGVDFYLIDSSVKSLSTEMGRDVWKTLVKFFDFEHRCGSHCNALEQLEKLGLTSPNPTDTILP